MNEPGKGSDVNFAERYGPWALIAGASEGTGRAFARKAANQGLNCILVARREAQLAALAEEIRAESQVECMTCVVDLAATDASDRIATAVGARDVGLYISNAGADPNGAQFLEAPIDSWVELVNRNVLTTLRCCHHFGGSMRARGRGGIILVGSGACYGGSSNLAVYSASKAFDLCLGEGLWTEFRHHGVDVLNLILGRTDTPAFRELLARKGLPVPAGLASPEEVAEVGFARLPFGPIHNWGLQDDEVGNATNSAASRRERALQMERMTKGIFGSK
jgi:short-subunit dehydrogenase